MKLYVSGLVDKTIIFLLYRLAEQTHEHIGVAENNAQYGIGGDGEQDAKHASEFSGR